MPRIVADLHIHSHYSRATSRDLDFEHLSQWAQLKGVHLVATGDIAHPGWLQEMKLKLEPAEEGLLRLKDEYSQAVQQTVPAACQAPVRFMLAGEVSNIYKKNDKVRKIHHILFMPSLAAVEKLQARLEKIGNIRSDGRPILGLDSHDLLEIVLETDPQAYLIPAHIWTPWFALLGSMSGFDSVDECFDELTPYIFAVETGLSSDPPMNWSVSALDRYTLISNSDAHSPQKLAREATVFDTELSYPAIFAALKNQRDRVSTLEFFPEEGKYHYDGHRKCEIRWDPEATKAHKGLCPVCGKPVTVGVMNRVAMLADRKIGETPVNAQAYANLIPLPEILAEVYGVGAGSKQVQQNYEALLSKLGSELAILQDIPLPELQKVNNPLLAEGIRRMRTGELTIAAGYDGEYGVVKLFEANEREVSSAQLDLFVGEKKRRASKKQVVAGEDQPGHDTGPVWEMPHPPVPSPETRFSISGEGEITAPPMIPAPWGGLGRGLNPEQQAAVLCTDTPLIIVAGPGTGKTRTLTYRIAYLITEQGVAPETILAITFTNKAAEEMAQRLTALLGAAIAGRITIKTFHAFGALLLHEAGEQIGLSPTFGICSEEDRLALFKQLVPDLSEKEVKQILEQISVAKNQLLDPDAPALTEQNLDNVNFALHYQQYDATLRQNQLVDFDDLLFLTVKLLETHPAVLQDIQARFLWVSVDEYQDINLAQYRLLRLLTDGGANLCAIGDPDQAIYGFRGADRRYFLTFQQDFPGAQLLHLSQNYRSTQLILDASNQVITKSADRTALKIWSDFLDQTKLDIHAAPTDKAEAEYVVHQIEQMVGGTSYFSLDSGRVAGTDSAIRSFADFAVLYRLGAQSRLLMEAFDRSGIPYQVVGQTPLVEYKEIRELLAYLALVQNPDAPFYQKVLFNPDVPKRQQASIRQFLPILQMAGPTDTVAQLIERVQLFRTSTLAQKFDDKQTERIHKLVLRATPFASQLANFLEAILLQNENDDYDPRADRVTLMTLHAAKGLEFPVVLMVGCEESLLPYEMPGKPTDVEEERRLFYVGMTRAQRKLVLTHAKTRFLFGQRMQNEPSHFVNDIENTLKEIKAMVQRKVLKEKPEIEQLSLF
ncbi:MAG: UvrD-helicase domain-containing protein [Caldilineaceae bacterium]